MSLLASLRIQVLCLRRRSSEQPYRKPFGFKMHWAQTLARQFAASTLSGPSIEIGKLEFKESVFEYAQHKFYAQRCIELCFALLLGRILHCMTVWP